MNDYQLNHLAQDRQHDFHREAARSRLARSAARKDRQPGSGGRPRRSLRLTLDGFLGRVAL